MTAVQNTRVALAAEETVVTVVPSHARRIWEDAPVLRVRFFCRSLVSTESATRRDREEVGTANQSRGCVSLDTSFANGRFRHRPLEGSSAFSHVAVARCRARCSVLTQWDLMRPILRLMDASLRAVVVPSLRTRRCRPSEES